MEMKELTKAEEQIMQVLWEIKQGFVKDVIAELPNPKPAYNTVSTIIRILEGKGFIDHEAFGTTHRYFPIINIEDYKSFASEKLLNGYFGNSVEKMFSFFIKREKVDLKEADQILKLIEKLKKDQL
ncbi:MAG: BlaI/MecI/CopY family transcriptional regulator [Pedobacter sp.]|nr:MAG: BlaI/MecI/CopY family transcriptional regulator [Pedobacter sp.]